MLLEPVPPLPRASMLWRFCWIRINVRGGRGDVTTTSTVPFTRDPLSNKDFHDVGRFSSLNKSQHSKFQFDQERGTTQKHAKSDAAFSLNVVNLILILFTNLFLKQLALESTWQTLSSLGRRQNKSAGGKSLC